MFTLVFQPFLQPSRWRACLGRCVPASLFGRLAWVMVGMALVAEAEECVEAALRIVQFIQSRTA